MEVMGSIEGITSILISTTKFSFFIAVLVLAFLINFLGTKKKKDKLYGLVVMAISFALMAFFELLHTLAFFHEGIWPWVMMHGNLHLITHPLALIAGLGLVSYFIGIKRNIKNYI